jgi:DNA-binding NarL/FixJ family response regulator
MSRARWSMAYKRSLADLLSPEEIQQRCATFLEQLAQEAEGERLYVPCASADKSAEIRELDATGMQWRHIAKRLHVSFRTIASATKPVLDW